MAEKNPDSTPQTDARFADPTTMAVGEESGGPTTMAVGEEDPKGPTTMATGEEEPTPTTMALGEEEQRNATSGTFDRSSPFGSF